MRCVLLFLSLISVACQSTTEDLTALGHSDERRVVAAMIPQMQEQTRLEWIRYENSGFLVEDSSVLNEAQRTMLRVTFKSLRERERGVRQAMYRMSSDEDGRQLVIIVYLKDFEFEGRILDPIVVNHAVVQIGADGSIRFLPQA